jgi:hypothetical protein
MENTHMVQRVLHPSHQCQSSGWGRRDIGIWGTSSPCPGVVHMTDTPPSGTRLYRQKIDTSTRTLLSRQSISHTAHAAP